MAARQKLSLCSSSVKLRTVPSKPVEKRTPVQARAIRRREEILDATARVLERNGWDSLNTNAVAREAGAAIGTVYEYFRDKDELLAGLLERHEGRLREAIESAIDGGGDDLVGVADGVVDAFVAVWRSEPGYRAAWSATQTGGLLARSGDRWAASFARRAASLLRVFFPKMSGPVAKRVARTAVFLVSGLLLAAMAGSPGDERAMVSETKFALRAYLVARGGPYASR